MIQSGVRKDESVERQRGTVRREGQSRCTEDCGSGSKNGVFCWLSQGHGRAAGDDVVQGGVERQRGVPPQVCDGVCSRQESGVERP